jgi:hypothetical protein
MDAGTLIAQARAAGLTLLVEGDRVIVRGPRRAEPIVAALREHKAAVFALLAVTMAGPPANCTEPEAHRRSGHLWHVVPGLGWYCIAWACLPDEIKR